MLGTQTANARSMRLAAKLGFTEVQRYEAWGAGQWLGMRPRSRHAGGNRHTFNGSPNELSYDDLA